MSAKVPPITLICPWEPCSKPFEIHPRIFRSAAKLGKKVYCSPACSRLGSALARKRSVTLICAYSPCSIAFEVPPSVLKKPAEFRCCSRACKQNLQRMQTHATFADRVWAQVSIGEPQDCWPWQGRMRTDGYGVITHPDLQRDVGAHIAAWTLTHGRWPLPGMDICHSCDCPPCCNPAHLWEGTPHDNAMDAAIKGRRRSGERHHNNKLPESQWIEIAALVAAGDLSVYRAAKLYGLSKKTVAVRLQRMAARQYIQEHGSPYPQVS